MNILRLLTLIAIIATAVLGLSCGEPAPANNQANVPANRPNTMQNSGNSTVNQTANAANSMSNHINSTNSVKSANSSNLSVNAQISNSGSASRTPIPIATPEVAERRDQGLFSFPPPKVISVSEIKRHRFIDKNGTPTFLSQVSAELVRALDVGNYNSGDRFSFFWNDENEFAIVTAVERIFPNGESYPETDRWDQWRHPPRARSTAEYWDYLIFGKKAYYRVFAFVVTSRRNEQSFKTGSSPDFTMASEWVNKGSSNLADADGSVGERLFSERHRCYALLYLFVDHSSLDGPISVDRANLGDLTDDLSKSVKKHLFAARIPLSEE